MEYFSNETQFIQTIIARLGIDTYTWAKMDDRDKTRLLEELDRQRQHVIIMEV